jgi:hypothetical protein
METCWNEGITSVGWGIRSGVDMGTTVGVGVGVEVSVGVSLGVTTGLVHPAISRMPVHNKTRARNAFIP